MSIENVLISEIMPLSKKEKILNNPSSKSRDPNGKLNMNALRTSVLKFIGEIEVKDGSARVIREKEENNNEIGRKKIKKNNPLFRREIGRPGKESKKEIRKIILLIILLLCFILNLSLFAFKYWFESSYLKKDLSGRILPAIKVDGQIIGLDRYEHNLNAFKILASANFSELNESNIKNYLNTKLIKDKLLEIFLQKNGMVIDFAKIENYLEKKIYNRDDSPEHVHKLVADIFNWDITEYKKNIIKPLVMRDVLQEWIAYNDHENIAIKERAENISKIVAEATAEKGNTFDIFGNLAQKYNEDASSAVNGDLGFITRENLLKEVAEAVFALDDGEISSLVKSKYGYHIIRVDQKINNEAKKEDVIRAQHILIKFRSAEEYINQLVEKADIQIYVN